MKKILIAIILLLFSTHSVFATPETTDSRDPSVATSSGWINPDNILDVPNYTTSNLSPGNTSDTLYLDNYGFEESDVPDSKILVGLNVIASYDRSVSGNTTRLDLYISDDHCSTYKATIGSFDTFAANWTEGSDILHVFEWSKTLSSGDWETYYSNINIEGLCVRIISSSSDGWTGSVDIDYAQLALIYDYPSGETTLDSHTASPSAQQVSLDFSGDTGVSSDTMQCEVKVIQDCTSSTGGAGLYSQVASINLADNGNTQTLYLGGTTYEGYGWSDTSTTWNADSIIVPYNHGYSCYYDTRTICEEDGVIYQDFYTEGDTNIEHGSYLTEPEPDDPLQWIAWKIKNVLIDLFVPNFGLISEQFNGLKQALSQKAPFAYALKVTEFSTEPVSQPGIEFTVHAGFDDFEFTDEAGVVEDIIDTIVPIIEVIFYSLVFVYVFTLFQRLFK
jgi:hypothetical protein